VIDMSPSAAALADRPATTGTLVEDDFTLDLSVFVGVIDDGTVWDCPTDDGCGNTCAGSASSCNSFTDDPS
jgi:FxLD family lantipeptide